MPRIKTIADAVSFEWDEGNSKKNWLKHKVSIKEAQEVFFDTGKIVYRDVPHSLSEVRYIILGKAEDKRVLFVVYTFRREKVRIISARPANRKEVQLYEKENNITKVSE